MNRQLLAGIIAIVLIIVGMLTIPQIMSTANAPAKKKLPIYCVNREDKCISVSFDAAWGNEDTREILDILKKHKVKATFFMTGEWIKKYPEDVKALAAEGHDLGNHSMNHKQMSTLTSEECIKELQDAHTMVKELTGKDMTLFRPPYGDYNDTLLDSAASIKYHTIQWDVDSLDWKNYGVESIINTVCNHKHLGPGSIILMHNGGKYTKDALDSLLTNLIDAGYTLVPISELIQTENYYMDHEGRQFTSTSTPPPQSTK